MGAGYMTPHVMHGRRAALEVLDRLSSRLISELRMILMFLLLYLTKYHTYNERLESPRPSTLEGDKACHTIANSLPSTL